MAMMDISVVPVGTGAPSVSRYVAQAVRVAMKSGLPVTIAPMGTVVTGNVDELLALAGRMHKCILAWPVERVVTTIRIDDRTDKVLTAEGKVASLKEQLDAQ